jgi:hypothetical protein
MKWRKRECFSILSYERDGYLGKAGFLWSPQCPDWQWGLPSLLSNVYQGYFLASKVARQWSWPLASSAEVSAWRYISIPSYVCIVWWKNKHQGLCLEALFAVGFWVWLWTYSFWRRQGISLLAQNTASFSKMTLWTYSSLIYSWISDCRHHIFLKWGLTEIPSMKVVTNCVQK